MLQWLVAAALVAALCVFLRWFLHPVLSAWLDPPPLSYAHTLSVPAAATADAKQQALPFPQALLFDEDTWNAPGNRVRLSCIVPAYNESDRVQLMMDDAMAYLRAREQRDATFTYEIIFVDDGSKDDTADKILAFTSQFGADRVRLLKLAKNQGKGGAVQQGMLHARGEIVLFADADGATKFSDVAKLEAELMKISRVSGHGIAVGSRRHLQQDAVANRAWHRNLMMHVFHFLVASLTGIGHIADTQCGFKLFTRRTAQYLFVNQHLRRWCFDVELLYLSVHAGAVIDVVEVPVNWEEIPGSKINLIESSFLMTRDLMLIRLTYTFGVWRRLLWKNIAETMLHQKEAEGNAQVKSKDRVRNGGSSSSGKK